MIYEYDEPLDRPDLTASVMRNRKPGDDRIYSVQCFRSKARRVNVLVIRSMKEIAMKEIVIPDEDNLSSAERYFDTEIAAVIKAIE